MEKVKIKRISKEELQPKMLMLKAEGSFDEASLKLIELAALNGFPIELDEKQIEALKMLSFLEGEKENTVNARTVNENSINSTRGYFGGSAPEKTNRRKETREKVIDPNMGDEIVYTDSVNEWDIEQIKAKINVEVPPQEKDKKEQEQERQFVPDSPEDFAKLSSEEKKKMFYLTPERIIESIKRINDGKVWESLGYASTNELQLQTAIINAYQSCVYPGDLTDPNFLYDRVSNYLPADNQAVHFKELHRAALMGTYVGYHIEKNEGDVRDLNSDGTSKSNIAIVKFPTIVNEMPETLKDQTQSELVKAIKLRIEEIMRMPDCYKALTLLVPIDATMDNAIADYAEGLHDTEENRAIRAYIQTIRTDMSEHMKHSVDELNMSLDLSGINWENTETRKSVIGLIEKMQGQGRQNEVDKLVEEIDMSISVESPSDLEKVRAVCEDLGALSDEGIQVNIAFNVSSEERDNPELQQELDEVVSQYDNVSRDTAKEATDNITNAVFDEMIEMGVNASLNMEEEKPQNNVLTPGNVIAGLCGGAIALDSFLEQDLGEFIRPFGTEEEEE